MRRTGFKRYDYETALDRLRAKRQGKKPVPKFAPFRSALKRSNGRLKPGRKSKEWVAVRRQLKIEYAAMGITSCELGYEGCKRDDYLSFAHGRKRRKLVGDELRTLVILACQPCHNAIEFLQPNEMLRIVRDTIARRRKAA